MEKIIKLDRIALGVCYYPEHWPETLWEDDLHRMRAHGIEAVRVAEFAWSKIEPAEGQFTYEFFDRFLDLAKRCGVGVIFGTPTATPPAWLTQAYPEVLNARPDGVPHYHGMRRHYTYNSEKYCELTARIVEKIAAHYAPHPAVIGWQIDNELNCEVTEFYSKADHRAFREYLKERFGTLERFNDAMGTVFWNQTYTDWEEVHLRRPNIHNATNPHLSLEEKRFISRSTIRYCTLQADILKKYRRPDQFITTNGLFGHLDSHEMTESCLDFFTYDSYPGFAYGAGTEPGKPGSLDDRIWVKHLARVRSISPVFSIMEQQSGPGGWDIAMKQPAPKPGQMRLWTYQSVSQGADYVSYFRWRTAPVGTEIYWHGLNDYSNLPNRRMAELSRIAGEMQKLAPVAGARYEARVALVRDYLNEWDGEQDKWHGPLDHMSEDAWAAACERAHTPFDFLFLRESTTLPELARYGLLVYPHAAILTDAAAELLGAYVRGGGILVMGARTGYKDEYGRCPMRAMPGPAAALCGVTVTDFTALGPGDAPQYALWDGERIPAPEFNDILAPADAEVLAVFSGNYYDGAPALTVRREGSGAAYYFGAGFVVETAAVFLQKLGFAEPYADRLELPPETGLYVRVKEGVRYCLVLNYAGHTVQINVHKPMTDLLTEKTLSGSTEMEPYGVLVLRENNER